MKDPVGCTTYERVLGKPAPEGEIEGLRELAINHLFGKIWTRPGLSI